MIHQTPKLYLFYLLFTATPSIKELDSMILVIHHHERVGIIHTQACGSIELPRTSTLFTTQSLQQREVHASIPHLHHLRTTKITTTRHIHITSQINTYTTWTTGSINVGDGLMVMVIGRDTPNGQSLVVCVSHQEDRGGR